MMTRSSILDSRSSISRLRNSDRPADHQAARDEEEPDRPVKVEAEESGRVEIASMEEEQEQSEGNDAGRDRRPFEIFDFARCRRERIGGDVIARQTAQSADRKIDQDDLIRPGVEADSERDRREAAEAVGDSEEVGEMKTADHREMSGRRPHSHIVKQSGRNFDICHISYAICHISYFIWHMKYDYASELLLRRLLRKILEVLDARQF